MAVVARIGLIGPTCWRPTLSCDFLPDVRFDSIVKVRAADTFGRDNTRSVRALTRGRVGMRNGWHLGLAFSAALALASVGRTALAQPPFAPLVPPNLQLPNPQLLNAPPNVLPPNVALPNVPPPNVPLPSQIPSGLPNPAPPPVPPNSLPPTLPPPGLPPRPAPPTYAPAPGTLPPPVAAPPPVAPPAGANPPSPQPTDPPARYATTGRYEHHAASQPGTPRKFLVRVPSAQPAPEGGLFLAPDVQVTQPPDPLPGPLGPYGLPGQLKLGELPSRSTRPRLPTNFLVRPSGGEPELLPPGESPVSEPVLGETEPIFDDLVQTVGNEPRSGLLGWMFGEPIYRDEGVGRSRLANAPFALDTAQPMNNFRMRIADAVNHVFPDRSEYFWAKQITGRGPKLPDGPIDYQEFRLLMETGNASFSTGIEVPFRWTDPDNNPNHAGLSDLQLTLKTVLLNGEHWQITQLFRSHFNTGAPSSGLGTGHISLEPGLLFRLKVRADTYLHGAVTYFFPLGANKTHGGDVITYGGGLSYVLWENDYGALLPTVEVTGWSLNNGQQTSPVGVVFPVDGIDVVNVVTGLRVVVDYGGDLGLFEFGVSGSLPATADQFWDTLLRFDLRWSW